VQDKANLLLVHTHPKSIRSHHNLEFSLHEKLLNVMPRRCGKTGVVGLRRNIPAAQQPGKPFGFSPCSNVYNTRAPLLWMRHDLLHNAYRERVSFLR
jgi:hypothetical protein